MADMAEVKAEFASSRLDRARFVLIGWFMIEQRWRYVIEKELERDGITPAQWLMLIVIASGFRSPPSIQEAADAMSTTHQNVKQIAAGLERRGLMALERDPDNRRIIRLKVTEQCHALFRGRKESDVQTILRIFEGLTDDEMKALFELVAKLEGSADQLYGEAKKARLGAASAKPR